MLAWRFRLPLQKFRAQTTSSEFVTWCEFLKEELNYFSKEDWRLACLRQSIACLFLKEGDKPPPVEDFLPPKIDLDGLLAGGKKKKPESKEEELVVKTKEELEEEIKRDSDRARAFWLPALGLGPNGQPIRKTRLSRRGLSTPQPPKDKK